MGEDGEHRGHARREGKEEKGKHTLCIIATDEAIICSATCM